MNHTTSRSRPAPFVAWTLAAFMLAAPAAVVAQGRGGGAQAANARGGAPIDITGYWVSVVTEDWRFRMVTPPKGDYDSVPLNAEGRRVADMWDPASDEAAGEACRSYGAPAIMRVPGRLHITWANDNVLRVDTDAGTQTRLFHFAESQPQRQPDWQGHSVAEWVTASGSRGGTPGGSLRVVTTNLRPGYLRKNGVPYSANAVLEENIYQFEEPNGDQWLIAITLVTDPQYLTQPFITSTQFKKLPDASGWNPSPCSAS